MQIFHRATNVVSKVSILGAVFFIAALAFAVGELSKSTFVTGAEVARTQPIPFSHQHHVGGLGIDCRYCHTTVETTAIAGVPPTKTCMNCHSQIWLTSPVLEPVRSSFKTDQSIRWARVHDLPDFAYFDHSIHVKKGIGCVSCHGRIDRMELAAQVNTLQMQWCLDCHRAPEKYVRPRSEVFNLAWEPPGGDQLALGKKLVEEYGIHGRTSCSACHR
jgi:hypothetical protein